MFESSKIWENTLVSIKSNISKANFNTWFKNTKIEKIEGGTVYIGVPNEFVKEWLYTKYHKNIIKLLRDQSDHIRCVEYVISKKKPNTNHSNIQNNEIKITKAPQKPETRPNRSTNLNPRYTLETFIVGPFNELAFSAAQAIINKPGVYNPFFIYGETGLGKTHLIQGIGNALISQNPNLNIYYTSSEKFTMDLISALKGHKMNAFKDHYRKFDVLIMDDIQFLSGKEKTQEELFHLFNILYDNNKQIIFSSDKHPNYIMDLENRLRSRFSAGMVVDISRPEFESRVALITSKLQSSGHLVDNSIVEYIAKNLEGNIRELEGICNSLSMQVELKGNLNLKDAQKLIKDNIKPQRQVSIPDIVKAVASFYNVEEDLIYEKTRRKEIVKSRQIIMYILRQDYNISFPHIGKELGGRDHTTVIHSCDKIKQELEKDTKLDHEISQIRSMLIVR